MKVPVFITVRTTSSRLPNKCLLPFGEGNVLEHVIRRAINCNFDPIVCTSIEPSDDIIKTISINEGVKFFRGSLKNKLKRWLDGCDKYHLGGFHSIDADDPFFDCELISKSFSLLNSGYDVIYPTESSSAGAATVGFSLTRNILANACELVNDDTDTEMIWYFLEKLPKLKSAVLQEENEPAKVRLTLDYEEDYWLLRTVQRIVGSFAPRKEIDDLFQKNPDLYKLNWFRNEEWKQRQLANKP